MADKQAALGGREEAVAFREEVGEGAGVAKAERGSVWDGAIGGFKPDRVPPQVATAAVLDLARGFGAVYDGGEVRQMEEGACAKDGQGAVAIERKEEDAAKAGDAGADVGAEIELVEGAGGRNANGGAPDGAGEDVVHGEGDDAEPGGAIEGVCFKGRREQSL